MNFEIKIFKDNNVLDLLNDNDFISQWEKLAIQSEKVTIIQEPPFVITWYRQYFNKYQPVLILGFDENSILVGLMPLAFSLEHHYLTCAGDGQALYHGWLCNKDVDQDFPIQALIAVRRNFQVKKWQWRPLSPRSNIKWLSSRDLRKEKIYVRINEEDSPVLDLNDENRISEIIKDRSIHKRLNRYKKKDSFYIERIKLKEKAKEVFDILEMQCDFRQMAVHQTAPFAQDKIKKQFYLDRLNFSEYNHFTVLWSGKNPIAFTFGTCDSDTFYLGLSSHDPLEEKNSPGKINIIKLIEFLKVEGYHYLDLTPGKDEYKEEFASFHRKIYTPTIYFLKKDKIIADVKYFMKKSLISVGVEPSVIKNISDRILVGLKKNLKLSLREIIKKIFSKIYERKVYTIYSFLLDNKSLDIFQKEMKISVNNYSDLLLYNNSIPTLNKSELITRALRHFRSEDILCTITLNGVLAHYGWMEKGGKSHRFTEVGMDFNVPENSFILYDFFTEPNYNMQELFAGTLEKMLTECRKNEAHEVFIGVHDNDILSKTIIEKMGFKVFRKFQRNRTLLLVTKNDY